MSHHNDYKTIAKLFIWDSFSDPISYKKLIQNSTSLKTQRGKMKKGMAYLFFESHTQNLSRIHFSHSSKMLKNFVMIS